MTIIPNDELKSYYKQFRSLHQYKKKSDEEVMEIAKKSLRLKIDFIEITSKFIDKKEKKLAKTLLQKYLEDYNIETISDKNTLGQLVYLEIVHSRLENEVNVVHEENKGTPLIMIEALHKNSNEIVKLKNSLGLNKKEEEVGTLDTLTKLKKKFKIWLKENQGSRTLVCPHCAKMVLLKIRTEAWEAMQHPLFRDKVLYNKHLFENLDKTMLIDRDFISKVLECSVDYIDWINKISTKKVEKSTNAE